MSSSDPTPNNKRGKYKDNAVIDQILPFNERIHFK